MLKFKSNPKKHFKFSITFYSANTVAYYFIFTVLFLVLSVKFYSTGSVGFLFGSIVFALMSVASLYYELTHNKHKDASYDSDK